VNRGPLAALALLAATPAVAQPEGYLDLYYVPSAGIEVTVPGLGSGDDSGTGFGVKGAAPAANGMALLGEYQAASYDGGDDLNQLRFGFGFLGEGDAGAILEYVAVEEFVEADGLGLHLRFGGERFYAQAGYLLLNDDFEGVTGPEFAFGLDFRGRGRSGLFVDVRHSVLKTEETDVEFELTDIRAGVRILFQR
jgi:hypothetical protein